MRRLLVRNTAKSLRFPRFAGPSTQPLYHRRPPGRRLAPADPDPALKAFLHKLDASQYDTTSRERPASTEQQPGEESPPLVVREDFPLPKSIPSWYVGHMYRAMRSFPSLLSRNPPPLIIEARDARLPTSSINPSFEQLLRSLQKKQDRVGKKKSSGKEKERLSQEDIRRWTSRRLVVYNKADLIDSRLIGPIVEYFANVKHEEVMFIDTSKDKDVKRVIHWVKEKATFLSIAVNYWEERHEKGIRLPKSAREENLSGAFKHTPTPEDGIRLIIVGMPNVGKSSLLNALRRVGTGKGKAASTAPEPGHTRKLTGTVRITPQQEKPKEKKERGGEMAMVGSEPNFELDRREESNAREKDPAVYVYDTPGIMVPFLGNGKRGAERGLKLAVTAGVKTSLFDVTTVADYLLYRMNLQWRWQWKQWDSKGRQGPEPKPQYIEHLPLDANSFKPTNEIETLLENLALKAPGTLSKGGERDLEKAANFMVQRWRDGKMGKSELDLGCFEHIPHQTADEMETISKIDTYTRAQLTLQRYFDQMQEAEEQGVGTSSRPALGADRKSKRRMEKLDRDELLSERWDDDREGEKGEIVEGANESLLSNNQAKKRSRQLELAIRNSKLREKGVPVKGWESPSRPAWRGGKHGGHHRS